MYSLSIDTTCGQCSVALGFKDKLLDYLEEPMLHQQSERLLSLVQDILKNNTKNFSDITDIYLTLGPGSFTGCRIGLSAVQGMNIVLNARVIGVTTLEAIFAGFKHRSAGNIEKKIAATIYAGRDQWYFQDFTDYKDKVTLSRESTITLKNEAELKDYKACKYKLIGYPEKMMPNAKVTFLAVQEGFGKDVEADTTPVYVREPDAAVNKHRR